MPYRSNANYDATGTFLLQIPELSTINDWDFGSNSNYNAGQISFRKRAAGGLFYRLNYSFSKSIGDASQLTGASAGGLFGAPGRGEPPPDPPRGGWGSRPYLYPAVLLPPAGRSKKPPLR